MKSLFFAAAALVAVATGSANAATAVSGDSIVGDANLLNFGSDALTSTAVVSSGTEFTIFFGTTPGLDVDFSENMFTLTEKGTGTLGLTDGRTYLLNFTDMTNAFAGATLISNVGVSAFGLENFSVVGGVLKLDLTGTSFTDDGSIQLALSGSAGGVAEPASWALMMVGFGGIGAALRRGRTFASQPC